MSGLRLLLHFCAQLFVCSCCLCAVVCVRSMLLMSRSAVNRLVVLPIGRSCEGLLFPPEGLVNLYARWVLAYVGQECIC